MSLADTDEHSGTKRGSYGYTCGCNEKGGIAVHSIRYEIGCLGQRQIRPASPAQLGSTSAREVGLLKLAISLSGRLVSPDCCQNIISELQHRSFVGWAST